MPLHLLHQMMHTREVQHYMMNNNQCTVGTHLFHHLCLTPNLARRDFSPENPSYISLGGEMTRSKKKGIFKGNLINHPSPAPQTNKKPHHISLHILGGIDLLKSIIIVKFLLVGPLLASLFTHCRPLLTHQPVHSQVTS